MKKTLTILLSLLLIAALVVSCGGKDSKKAAAETTTASTAVAEKPAAPKKADPAPAKKAEPAPKKAEKPAPAEADEVIFRLSNGAEPESIDPARIQGVPEHRIFMALFEGLVACDPVTADAIPGVAESWDISEDGMQYTFHLRKDAKWSDGVPITAHDVVYSWLRGLAPETGSPYAWFPSMFLKGGAEYNAGEAGPEAVQIRALDDHTFQMDLVGPLPYVLGALEHYSFAITPQHAIEKYGDAWATPDNFVGNGPFVLESHVPQTSITVKKNPNYWDAENVKLDKVVFYASDNETTNYNMFLNGELDWDTSVPTDQIAAAKMRKEYKASPQLSTYYYVMNCEKGPTANVNIRKALALAFDREALVEGVTKAGQIPAWGIVPPMSGYEALEFPNGDDHDADIEQAQQYLADAGYPNGVGLPPIEILYNTSEGHKQIAEFVQQEWKDNLGIDVVLVNEEWQTYLADRNQGKFEIARAGWVGDYQDPNTFLDMFVTGGAMNGGRYSNEIYDLLIHEAAKTAPEDRFGVLRTAEDMMINQDQAIIPFYYYVTLNMIDTDKWGGWHTNVMDYHPLKDIYLR